MSEKIPWTDPGGTPCCCTVCEYFAPMSSETGVVLSQEQYATLFAGGYFETLVAVSGSYSLSSWFYDITSSYSLTHKLRYNKPANECNIDNTFEVVQSTASHNPEVTENDVEDPPTSTNTTSNDSTSVNEPASNIFGLALRLHDTNGPENFEYGAVVQISGVIGYATQITADYTTARGPDGNLAGLFGLTNIARGGSHVFRFRNANSFEQENFFIDLKIGANTLQIPAIKSQEFSFNLFFMESDSYSGSFTTDPQITFVPSPP